MRLRLGVHYKDLAKRFSISVTSTTSIYHSWLDGMFHTIGQTVCLFDRHNVSATLPQRFQCLPNLRAILGSAEIPIQTPSDAVLQNVTWSTNNNRNTAKFFIAISPNSQICFVSQIFGGSATEREITLETKFLDVFNPGDMLQVGGNFQIQDECFKRAIDLNITDTSIADKVIKRLQSFKVMSEATISEVPSLYKIVLVCSSICNFSEPIYTE